MSLKGYGSHSQPSSEISGREKSKPFGFGFYEKTSDGKKSRIMTMKIMKNDRNIPVVLLDDIKAVDDERFCSRIYLGFKYGDGFSNELASLEGTDERGDPFAVALREPDRKTQQVRPKMPSRVWLMTGILLTEFTYAKGPKAGQVKKFPRVIVPIPLGDKPGSKVSREDEFLDYAVKLQGGLRGQEFECSRGAGDTTPRIGERWFPRAHYSEADLKAKFADAARAAGMTVDQYITPVDYWSMFKPMSYDDAYKGAFYIAKERGFDLTTAIAPPPGWKLGGSNEKAESLIGGDEDEAHGNEAPEVDAQDLPF